MSSSSKSSRLFLFASIAVPVFWGVMMFTLVRDRVLPQRRAAAVAARSVSPAMLTQSWEDVVEYMLVKFGDITVGAAETTVRRIGGNAPRFEANLRVGLRSHVAGLQQAATILARADLDTSFILRRFHIALEIGDFALRMNGVSDDEFLLLRTDRGGQSVLSKYTLAGPISLLEAVRPAAARNLKIEPGQSLAIPVIDPVMSMQIGTMEMTVGEQEPVTIKGQPLTAYRVETRLGDFSSTSWVAPDGATLRRQLAGGFMLDAATSDTARAAAPEIFTPPLSIPVLDEAAFKNIEPQPISKLLDRSQSPLSILGAFSL